jgi:hypothetical protein
MENTRRQAPPPRPLRTTASIDTIEMFARCCQRDFADKSSAWWESV